MLFKVTDAQTGRLCYFDAANIRSITTQIKPVPKIVKTEKREAEYETVVVTYFITQSGPYAFVVSESPEEVARAVNAALAGKNLLVD